MKKTRKLKNKVNNLMGLMILLPKWIKLLFRRNDYIMSVFIYKFT